MTQNLPMLFLFLRSRHVLRAYFPFQNSWSHRIGGPTNGRGSGIRNAQRLEGIDHFLAGLTGAKVVA